MVLPTEIAVETHAGNETPFLKKSFPDAKTGATFIEMSPSIADFARDVAEFVASHDALKPPAGLNQVPP